MRARQATAASILLAAPVAVLPTGTALAQFASPAETEFRERIVGTVILGENAPTPEPGDQIGAVFEDQIIGVFSFSSGQDEELAFDIVIFGDDPNTEEVEGPEVGDPIAFRFFDSSRNAMLSNIVVLNEGGETVNLTFQGSFVPVVPGVGLDLTPSRGFDLRLGEGGDSDGGDGNGGDGDGGSAGGNPDVNGDGTIDKRDAALVVRIFISSGRGVTAAEASAADVNGDGAVNTDDAIAVLRASREQ